MADDTFQSLGLSRWILNSLEKINLKRPTAIQKNCIPPILDGKDCIGAAKTGSGKTFAFALPILEKLSEEPTAYFALILTPTHELAYQISEQFQVIGKPMNLKVCVISGGTDMLIESQNLQKRPHIVVAMPGRLADHLTGCDTFSFDALKFLVVDEADRVLSGSFDETLEVIEERLPKERQNIFISATMKDCLKESKVFPVASDVFEWAEDSTIATVDTLDQRYLLCADYDRDMVMVEALRKFTEINEKANVIVFTNTKKDCQILSLTFEALGFQNVCLHGFMRQKERVAALARFKSSQARILIATDVASRGLDIPNVQLVLNHRLPKFTKEYIHRVGRTARAGRTGLAITIFRFPHDLHYLHEIEKTIGTKLTEWKVDLKMVDTIFMQVSVARREAGLKINNEDFDERIQNYRRKKWITEGLDPDEMEAKYEREVERRAQERKQARIEVAKKRKAEPSELLGDQRFKVLDERSFHKKQKKFKGDGSKEKATVKGLKQKKFKKLKNKS